MNDKFLTPEGFWESYVEMLNDSEPKLTINDYQNNSGWTKQIITRVRKMIHSKMETKIETQKEYFRIDVIGYTTRWPDEIRISQEREKNDGIKMRPLHNWKLRVAYEHENSSDWSDELCKLCHVAADLRVISSYCDFSKEDIEETLKYYIERLSKEGTMRRAEGKWLFVFGPRKKSGGSFKAYTLDDDMNVIPLEEIKMTFLSSNA